MPDSNDAVYRIRAMQHGMRVAYALGVRHVMTIAAKLEGTHPSAEYNRALGDMRLACAALLNLNPKKRKSRRPPNA